MKTKLTNQRILSVIIGFVSGAWLGWVMNITLNNYDLTFPGSLPTLIILLAALVGFWAYKMPRTVEILIAGGVISLILIGAIWDLIINDWSSQRALILLTGLGILLFDVFFGSITIKDVARVGKRLFGGN